MRIAIVGAGGIGGYLAAKLADWGAEVVILARGDHLDAIRRDGLRLREPEGELLTHPPAFGSASEIGNADLVVFGVKAQQLGQAIDDARPLMGEDSMALPFQNGVDAHPMLSAAFGADRTLIGVARIFATIAAPGIVDKVSPFARFTIGNIDGDQASRGVERVCSIFVKAGIEVPDCADVNVDLWEKFVLMNAISATTAAARADIGTIRSHPESWALFRTLAEEAATVGRARGVMLDGAVERVMEAAGNLPSALRASQAHDLDAGRPLEVDWLSGAVVRLGAELGIPTPASAAVVALLAPWRKGRAASGA